MLVSEELLVEVQSTLEENQKAMTSGAEAIQTIGCFGCGLGCSGTVGG